MSKKGTNEEELKPRKLTEKQTYFLECLQANNAHISNAAKAAKIERSTFYAWLRNSEDFKAAYKETLAGEYDFAVSQMKVLMRGIPIIDKNGKLSAWGCKPSETALLWYLNKLAPYGEVFDESENIPQNNIHITHTFVNSRADNTEDQLKF